MPNILALDQGTTSSRAILFNDKGEKISIEQKEFEQIFPQPGWVEHNPDEIWQTQIAVAEKAVSKAGISKNDIACIGITNQRETVVVWDKKTGQPITNAIVWQDRRTSSMIDLFKDDGTKRQIQQKTGLVPDAYFSSSKIKWILENVDGARQKQKRVNWLLEQLTHGLSTN